MSNGLNRPRLNGRETKPQHQYRHVMEHGFIRKFTWRERLKIALGYEASFEVTTCVMHNPGAVAMTIKTSLSSPFKVWVLSKMARVSSWFRGKVGVAIGLLLLATSAGAQINNHGVLITCVSTSLPSSQWTATFTTTNTETALRAFSQLRAMWATNTGPLVIPATNCVDLTNPLRTNQAMVMRADMVWITNSPPGVTCTNKTEEDIILAYRMIQAAEKEAIKSSVAAEAAIDLEQKANSNYAYVCCEAARVVTNAFSKAIGKKR